MLKFILLLLFCATQTLGSTFLGQSDLVQALPGLSHALLSSKHYSGYLPALNGTHLHYWFFESSSSKPEADPLVLWLNGGPGCSSLLGALTELGPLLLLKNGTLAKNPFSWTQKANILFLESPAGVGFSYRSDATGDNYTSRAYGTSDKATAEINFSALKGFFGKFPHLTNSSFYIAGESYAGIYIPTLASLVHQRKFPIHFRGIAIGNGLLDEALIGSSLVHFGYYHGLIDGPMYQDVLAKCCSKLPVGTALAKCNIVSMEQTMDCFLARGTATDKLRYESQINPYNIYKRCEKEEETMREFSFNLITPESIHAHLLSSILSGTESSLSATASRNSPPCVNFDYLEKWINQPEVKKSLHVDTTRARDWVPCSFDVSLLYERQYKTVKAEIKEVLEAGVKVLIYNGDVDSMCNFLGDQWFVDSLGLKVIQPYSPWMLHGQVAGFTKKYEKNLTFTTIRGAGHTVPEDKPEEALAMFSDFIKL